MNPALVAKDVDLCYGGRRILEGVSFSVDRAEFFVIIGPNGSGKTSLLKAISGTAALSGGVVEVFGRPLPRWSKKAFAKSVALVPQVLPSDIQFTVFETVLMARSPHIAFGGVESPMDLQIAENAMSLARIEHLADRKVNRLSAGERQRAFIARAICQQPRMIVLDEPTASLDIAHQVQVMDLLTRLGKETGLTVLMVSHDLNLAAMYADRILLLKDGKVMSLGAPREALTVATLRRAYGCALLIDEHPVQNVPRITVVTHRSKD